MTMKALELESTSAITDLDWEYTPACEGTTHHLGMNGHKPEEPAAWLMVMPCCGPKILVCNARREQIRAQGELHCGVHDRVATADEIRFDPINE